MKVAVEPQPQQVEVEAVWKAKNWIVLEGSGPNLGAGTHQNWLQNNLHRNLLRLLTPEMGPTSNLHYINPMLTACRLPPNPVRL